MKRLIPLFFPLFCSAQVVLDECNDPIACNYNQNWFEPGGFCIYCDTPDGGPLCNEYQNDLTYWTFYSGLFDCEDEVVCDTVFVELPGDTVVVTEYIELPPDTIIINDTVVVPINWYFYDTTYIYINDTIVEYVYLPEYIYLPSDTVYTYEYDMVEIDCNTGYPCVEPIPSCPIYVPNAFTPDNDGLNDVWGAETDESCWLSWNLFVFSRSGQLVWQSFDPSDIWLGGDEYYVPSDIYLYRIECETFGNAYIINGHVTVVR